MSLRARVGRSATMDKCALTEILDAGTGRVDQVIVFCPQHFLGFCSCCLKNTALKK